jgi:hypothetical protein
MHRQFGRILLHTSMPYFLIFSFIGGRVPRSGVHCTHCVRCSAVSRPNISKEPHIYREPVGLDMPEEHGLLDQRIPLKSLLFVAG